MYYTYRYDDNIWTLVVFFMRKKYVFVSVMWYLCPIHVVSMMSLSHPCDVFVSSMWCLWCLCLIHVVYVISLSQLCFVCDVFFNHMLSMILASFIWYLCFINWLIGWLTDDVMCWQTWAIMLIYCARSMVCLVAAGGLPHRASPDRFIHLFFCLPSYPSFPPWVFQWLSDCSTSIFSYILIIFVTQVWLPVSYYLF